MVPTSPPKPEIALYSPRALPRLARPASRTRKRVLAVLMNAQVTPINALRRASHPTRATDPAENVTAKTTGRKSGINPNRAIKLSKKTSLGECHSTALPDGKKSEVDAALEARYTMKTWASLR